MTITEGIDISGWSEGGHHLDVAAIISGGAQFVYHQATDGTGTLDSGLLQACNDLRAGGLSAYIGAYHFLRIRHERAQDADEQCKEFLDAASRAGAVLPLWLDCELGMDKASPRWNGLASPDEVKAAIELFYETLDKISVGRVCPLYSSPGEVTAMGTAGAADAVVSRGLCVAEYSPNSAKAAADMAALFSADSGAVLFHQYQGTSPYPGVPNGADRVRFFGSLAELQAM